MAIRATGGLAQGQGFFAAAAMGGILCVIHTTELSLLVSNL